MGLESHVARYSEIMQNWPKSEEQRRIDSEVDSLIACLHSASEAEVRELVSPYDGGGLTVFYSRRLAAINASANDGEFAIRLDGVTTFPAWVGEDDLTLKTKTHNKTEQDNT